MYVKNRFWTIPNLLLNNKDVTFKAKWLYWYIQSKPDNWEFSADRIKNDTKESRDAILSWLQELEHAWYLLRNKYKNEKWQWEVDYILYDIPTTENPTWELEKTTTENPTPQNPTPQNPTTNKERNSNKEIVINKEIYIEVFNFWNSLNIINHKVEPDNFRKLLDKKIKKYNIETIKQTMKKYSEVVLWKNYWFNYKWTLQEFLSRKNWFDVWVDTKIENYEIWNNFRKVPQNALKDKVDLWEINFWNDISLEDYLSRNKKG